ncbi:MAG TPA: zinc ABC transporter substrate-binding protein [Rhodothermales bacterium]|nr:zinc ABC transporter substrate-binding protein [Rhodothermales bacterium]
MLWSSLLVLGIFLTGCASSPDSGGAQDFSNRTINVVATTSMIADLVDIVGGDRVDVQGLMGPGVDPHLYKASEGDVARMAGADVIFYNGLHLEGKMTEVFEQMAGRNIPTIAVAEGGVPDSLQRESALFTGNFDPHVWFDVTLWSSVAQYVADELARMDSTHATTYEANVQAYLQELEALNAYVRRRAKEVPVEQRVLVTSHDAFGYFGRAYDFEVRGLQGISTATEAGTADVQELAEEVARRHIPAMFVESSVSPRGIEAVREAVRARGFEVAIGGTLYGDALGPADTPEGAYLGMVRHNIDTIVDALRPESDS